MLKHGVEYHDLGPSRFEQDKQAQARRLIRHLRTLGVECTIDAA
jgi:hypothetical protein